MTTFIKAGFWEQLCKPCKGYKGWLNLDELIKKSTSGLVGPQGPQGEQGIQGIQGIQGLKGDKGDQGTAGNSVTILGSVADMAAFLAGPGASPGANVGDAWILLSDGSLMSWNGTNWFDAGDIKGPKGDTGSQGPQGIQGPQGEQGVPGLNGSVGYHGSFYDTTNQTGIVGNILTMNLGNSDLWNNGVSITSGNRVTVANPGVYNIAFSAQMVKNVGNTATHVHIWLSQNGLDVPFTASQIGFPSNSVYVVTAWNFFFKTTVPNEYVQLKWEINSNVDNAVVITSAAPSGNIPAIPGIIVTVNQVG